MNIERLQEVATRLRTVNPTNFNRRVFATRDFQDTTPDQPLSDTAQACAIGFLARWHPECWRFSCNGLEYFRPITDHEGNQIILDNGEPAENVYFDWEGAAVWFDLHPRSSTLDYLFIESNDDDPATPSQVADLIEQVITDYMSTA